jgi:hypothetical protein
VSGLSPLEITVQTLRRRHLKSRTLLAATWLKKIGQTARDPTTSARVDTAAAPLYRPIAVGKLATILITGEAGTALAVDWWKSISIFKVSQEF